MRVTKETRNMVSRFLQRLAIDQHVTVLENPTEELQHELGRFEHGRGRRPTLHSMADQAVAGRLEENYLFYTRRFPNNTTNNTIGAGAVAAQDYLYFTSGVGDQGSAAGYFSLANLTAQQTNMPSGGKIPTGRGFRMYDIGVSFNAQCSVGNMQQMLDISNMRFEKQSGQLVLQHGPIARWPGGSGVYAGVSTTATTTTIQAAANGLPALTNVRRYRNPRILSANDQFQYVLNCAAATPQSNTTVALTDFVEVSIWLFGQVLDRIPN